MATFVKFNQFVYDLARKVHKLETAANTGDALVIALTTTSPNAATHAVRADLSAIEIAYTNLSTRACVVSASGQSGGVYTLKITDLVLTASGAVATFRYVVLYNDTPTSPADPLIGYWDYGANVTLANLETFTIDFDDTLGVLTLT